MIVHDFVIKNTFKTILAINGIVFSLLFIVLLLSSMSIEQILTVPLSWLTNSVVTQTSESYQYGSVSGNIISSFYQINEGIMKPINALSYNIIGAIFFGAIISILVLISTMIKKLWLISFRVFIIWSPSYIFLILLKIDLSYTILEFVA
ncbi:hypothetical protein [Marinicellulosiphila megalodicopiae]|uniref:hypothetical protein n=1 Tax=Marinicellulosiphila megalodicopiae TaxID=2724896 RepID=UPI003BB17632